MITQDMLHERILTFAKDSSAVLRSRQALLDTLADGKAHYGINTGFGALAKKRIALEDGSTLQKNLLLSHAVGCGEPVSKEISSLILHLKICALAQGYSGISEKTFRALVRFACDDHIPVIPSQGSVGASGDLAPLAHMSLPLIGEGYFWDESGTKKIPACGVVEPIELEVKDGLALINGTQFMLGHGVFVMGVLERLLDLVDLVAAMSLEAVCGDISPFDERIAHVRPFAGHAHVAKNIRTYTKKSELIKSEKSQDPYSVRCIPQVHGASRDLLAWCASQFDIEAASVTDNPLVFGPGEVLSGGNFHGQPIAMALDCAALALSELGAISERRIYLLQSGYEGLPPFLVAHSGLNSGFMILQYTAAALASQNKSYCHPASCDSIPTCLGQEDHVSMGANAATKLLKVLRNVENIVAIELLCAAQALDFRRPLRAGKDVAALYDTVRCRIPFIDKDCLLEPYFRSAQDIVRSASALPAGNGMQKSAAFLKKL